MTAGSPTGITREGRAFLFDAEGSLLRFAGSPGHVYAATLRDVGGPAVDPGLADQAVRSVRAATRADYLGVARGYEADHESDRRYWFDFAAEVFRTISPRPRRDVCDRFVPAVYERFGSPAVWEADPLVVSVVRGLRRAGRPAALLTNADRRIHGILAGLGLTPLFDVVACAADVGFRKPSAEPFRYVTDALGVPAAAVTSIGNDPETDIVPALRAGMGAILLADPGGPPPPAGARVTDAAGLADAVARVTDAGGKVDLTP